MSDQLAQLKKEFERGLKETADLSALEKIERQFFSRTAGEFTRLMETLGSLTGEERKKFGRAVNELKAELEGKLAQKREELQGRALDRIAETEAIDVTQPKLPSREPGHLHPITQIQMQVEDFFRSMDFMSLDGPELESEYYNFEALNIPAAHPARDLQDTFYIKNHPRWVMRTHTSPVQVRAMQTYGAPLRVIVPGRCFRNEATDARHEHTFYQVEGLVVDSEISFAHMKGVLEALVHHLYGEKTKLRLRPKYYPFVEPGVNGEVTCFLCHGQGCRMCKQSGWLEIFGAGTVHPFVIKAGGLDPNKYSGFAFGFGLDRLVMLKYGIEDIRHMHSGDLRFLEQF